LGVVVVLVSASFGDVWGILGLLTYTVVQINAILQKKRADEFFTTLYGGLIWNKVTYLGGHPEFRTSGVKGVVLIAQKGVVLVDRYRADARTLFMIPVDRISRAESIGSSNKVIAWSDGMPIPMTFTTSEEGMLAVQFVNDLNDASTANFRVGNGAVAAYLKNQIDYTVYDWKGRVGGLQST
jgi:hypothetical protein